MATSAATTAGWWIGRLTVPVPSLILSVWAARKASEVTASKPQASADQTASMPIRSAAWTYSTALATSLRA